MLALSIVPVGFAQAEKLLAKIQNGFPKAAADAINRGLVAGRKVATQAIRAKYNIAASEVKARGLPIKRATWTNVNGSLEAKGAMLPLTVFKPTVRWRSSARRGRRNQFVTAAIIKGGKKLIKGAFMAKGRVWERRGPERDAPLGIVSTIGVPHMLGSVGVSKKVEETIAKVTAARLAHNVELFLKQGKAEFPKLLR